MNRRTIMALLGGAAALPIATRAQQAMPVIGVVRVAVRGQSTHLEDAFRLGLTQAGYVENHNVAIEWRWLEGLYERLPDILTELIGRPVAAIVVPGSAAAAPGPLCTPALI